MLKIRAPLRQALACDFWCEAVSFRAICSGARNRILYLLPRVACEPKCGHGGIGGRPSLALSLSGGALPQRHRVGGAQAR
jgi:hypothetical protein